MSDAHTYDDEEVREILRRALEEEAGLGHDELAAGAAEVGIEPDRFERAAKAVRGERSRTAAIERRRARRRGRLARTGATFLVINLFLLAVDFLAGGGWWFYWPLISMALLYALQIIGHFSVDDEAAVVREEAKRAKQLRKANRKERRQRRAEARRGRRRAGKGRLRDAEDAFEEVVETGLARLLESIASGLESVAGETRGDGEFADFVARKEGRPRKERGAPEPAVRRPAVRVDATDDGPEAEDAEVRDALAEIERELRR